MKTNQADKARSCAGDNFGPDYASGIYTNRVAVKWRRVSIVVLGNKCRGACGYWMVFVCGVRSVVG